MNTTQRDSTRREFLAACSAGFAATSRLATASENDPQPEKDRDQPALIAISLDLEMSRNFPKREDTHWDFEKGNLNEASKRYALNAARRVKDQGGKIHFFALGQTMEQEKIDWLQEISKSGHPIGNHTYDHIYVKAKHAEEIQFRFRRAPWLIEGKSTRQVIEENVRMAARALKVRGGIEVSGFRTPGGFADGLRDRPDVQDLLLKLGYRWVSSVYPKHPPAVEGQAPDLSFIQGVIAAQADAQPFVYPSGLIEVPMSPVSDINAFRTGRWSLDSFLEVTRASVTWAIENGATFDFLAHPSCLGVVDPEFRAIDLICRLVREAGPRAALADLDTLATRARPLPR